jgi:SAM-dependent methyltransferase
MNKMLLIRDNQGAVRHFCYPLVDPRWVGVGEASHMRPDDPVLGLEFDGQAWALPWWIMKNHHTANLTLNGKPVFVALCEACSTAGAFDPVIDGRRLTFRLDAVYNGTNMSIDYETGSRWPSPTGEAIEGPLKGRVMERLPLLLCNWSEWTAMHPGTLVPDGAGESREGHGEGHFPGAPSLGSGMVELLHRQSDRRLPHYELVLGVLAGDQSRCYPLAELARHGPAVNDTLGGEPVAVLSRPGSWLAAAYSRRIDDRCLTFRRDGDAILDEETGSQWEVSGRAVAGPLQGRQLRYLHCGVEEFFIWAAFHPDTDIYGVPATQQTHPGWSLEMLSALHRITIGTGIRVSPGGKGIWPRRGMRLIDIGCGEGVIAAWMAESGLDVLAVDFRQERIERAQRQFRGMVRLRFDVWDIRGAMGLPEQFDALIDHSCLHTLPRAERPAYAANAAAIAKPGATFLILAPVTVGMEERVTQGIRTLFQSSFDWRGAKPLQVPHPTDGTPTQGTAVLLVRR